MTTENTQTPKSGASRYIGALAVAAVAGLIAMVLCYGVYDGYMDHGEPIVAAAAFKMLDGAQVYRALDGPNFVSNVYGPYLYLVNGLFLAVFGGSSWGGKISGLCAILLVVLVIWRTHRGAASGLSVLLMCGFAALFVPFSIWNRPDPFLILLTALSVFIARERVSMPRWLLWALMGVAGGMACGLKIYGPLFILPAAMYVILRHKSLAALFVMGAVGIATVMLPFALPMFDLGNYLMWFKVVASKPDAGDMATRALRYGVFFLFPAGLLFAQRASVLRSVRSVATDPQAVYAFLTIFGAGLCVVLASKPGAGMYYLLPFAPLAIDMLIRTADAVHPERKKLVLVVAGVMAAVLLVTAVPVQKRYYRALDWTRTTGIKEDLHAILRDNPGKTIQMAVGSTIGGYHNTLQKTELVYAGQPYTVDFGIMIETSYLGIGLSPSLIETFSACAMDVWLVPKDEPPLTMRGYYGNFITTENLRDAFLKAYEKTGTTAYYDLWTCRKN